MIFQMDAQIDKNKINDPKYVEEFYKNFCKNYIDQIKDKLNFHVELLEIDNPKLKKEDQLKEDSKEKEPKKINIIRYRMEMVNPVIKKNAIEKTKKPTSSHKNANTKEEAIEIKNNRKEH
jgi:hypothetical protein